MPQGFDGEVAECHDNYNTVGCPRALRGRGRWVMYGGKTLNLLR